MTKKYNFIFFHGRLEALDYFTRQILNAAQSLGFDYYLVDFNKPETYQSDGFDAFLARPNCVAFLFNQIGLLLTDHNGNNIWETHHIPVYSFIVDHPRNFYDAFLSPIKNLHVITLDRNHVSFIRQFYPAIQNVYFLPNGGAAESEWIPFSKRKTNIVYMGDCQSEQEYPNLPELGDDVVSFYKTCVVSLIQTPTYTTENVILDWLKKQYPSFSQEQILSIILTASISIEETVRRYFKQNTMIAIDQAGLSVDIYGNGWETPEYTFSDRIHIHSRVPSDKSNQLIGQSKIALNFMPWYKDGCSERVFNNMLNGAVCVTDKSRYLTERFSDGKHLIFFDLNNPEQLTADIRWLLQHPDAAERIARAGMRAAKNDTWAARFSKIISFIDDLSADAQ